MSVLNLYEEDVIETALTVAWLVRDEVKLALLQDNHEVLRYGICATWDEVVGDHPHEGMLGRIRDGLYSEWPQFSGNSWYPIPMPELDEDDYFAYREQYITEHHGDDSDVMSRPYWMYEQVGNMWDGEYGALRMDCLDWMIETLEAAVL